jgi:pyridoxine 5-phosphate synthase
MSTIKLGVNIDHVATLRQARGTIYPEPLDAALAAIDGGCDSITVHLREDRRHIQDRDVELLKEKLSVPLNLEMAVTDEMISIAEALCPAYCCFVPERREELTTEGGLDVAGQLERVGLACERLSRAGVRVSLFIDPDSRQIEAARDCAAPMIEIHTGHYADAVAAAERRQALERIHAAALRGANLGLQVNAGHGLNYDNVQPVAAITEIVELNIGHSIVAKSLFVGMETAVSEMHRLMTEARL